MGIRDEILALSEQWEEESWSHIYNQALVDAAHILDEWKLVKEYHCQPKGAVIEIWDDFEGPIWASKRFEPGDHIAIYKRIVHDPNTGRGKEDE